MLDPLIQAEKAITFPKQSFDFGGRDTTKEEECIGDKKAAFIFSFNDGGERINSIAKVSVSANNIYAGKGIEVGIFKHSAPP